MMDRYVALLRGINVGGHKKVPMADLKALMAELGFDDVKTLLNSGNVIFSGPESETQLVEKQLAEAVEEKFGFAVPILVRHAEQLMAIEQLDPFQQIDVTKDIRRYVSFLKSKPDHAPDLPWESDDGSFKIVSETDGAVFSVLDLSIAGTPDAMKALEQLYGKDITTRNWKTAEKIIKLL